MKYHNILRGILTIVVLTSIISCSSGSGSTKDAELEFTSPQSVTIASGTLQVIEISTTSESSDELIYRISGEDEASFSISENGVISFVEEALSRTYHLIVEIDSNGKTISQDLTVIVAEKVNHTPEITSSNNVSAEENQDRAFTVSATDEDGDSLVYGLESGDDIASFSINSATGEVVFIEVPDFETKSTYIVNISASDNLAKATQSVTITIEDIAEGTAPVITNVEIISVDENQRVALTINATDTDGDTLVYSLEGGADDSKFDINSTTGEVIFKVEPDYETKNRYDIVAAVNDGLDTTTKSIQININDLTGISNVIRTGQLISYTDKDDGTYQNGLSRNFTKTPTEPNPDYYWITNANTGKVWRDSPAVFSIFYDLTAARVSCHGRYDEYSNWRLPTIIELSNTASRDTNTNSLFYFDDRYNTDENQALSTWSSTTDSDGNRYAFNFNTNSIERVDQTTILKARCVAPTSLNFYYLYRFQRILNIINDSQTKLQWHDSQEGQSASTANFEDAINGCENLVADGKNDWKLPNTNELLSITDYQKDGGVGLFSIFATNTAGKYLSSTTSANDETKAMYMNFREGTQNEVSKLSRENYRCVRNAGD